MSEKMPVSVLIRGAMHAHWGYDKPECWEEEPENFVEIIGLEEI